MISCTLELFRMTPPPGSREEVPDRLARAQERPAQIDREDPVEIGRLDLVTGARLLNAGVIDQNVERPNASIVLANIGFTCSSFETSACTDESRARCRSSRAAFAMTRVASACSAPLR